jgi:hypothetical protein
MVRALPFCPTVILIVCLSCCKAMKRPKSRSFDSAEVRFTQDDRSIFDMNFGLTY